LHSCVRNVRAIFSFDDILFGSCQSLIWLARYWTEVAGATLEVFSRSFNGTPGNGTDWLRVKLRRMRLVNTDVGNVVSYYWSSAWRRFAALVRRWLTQMRISRDMSRVEIRRAPKRPDIAEYRVPTFIPDFKRLALRHWDGNRLKQSARAIFTVQVRKVRGSVGRSATVVTREVGRAIDEFAPPF